MTHCQHAVHWLPLTNEHIPCHRIASLQFSLRCGPETYSGNVLLLLWIYRTVEPRSVSSHTPLAFVRGSISARLPFLETAVHWPLHFGHENGLDEIGT